MEVSGQLHAPYPWGNSPQYPLDRKLGGPQSWTGYSGKEKNPCPCQGIKPCSSSPQPSHYIDLTILADLEVNYYKLKLKSKLLNSTVLGHQLYSDLAICNTSSKSDPYHLSSSPQLLAQMQKQS